MSDEFILEQFDEDEERESFDDECCFPGGCCMPGPHFPSECHTAEMMEEINKEFEAQPSPVAPGEPERPEPQGQIPDIDRLRWEAIIKWAYANAPDAVVAIRDLAKEVVEARAALTSCREERDRAQAANERDRATLHRIVRQVDEEITGRMWLIDGRGAYEWDDDRYRQEFGWAVNALQKKLEPLRKIAGDLSNCPTTQTAVDAALKPVSDRQPEGETTR